MIDGPTIMRTAFRSLVARPVGLVVGQREPLQVGEEVVAEVVLDVARDADDDPAHQEAEHRAHERNAEQHRGVVEQLVARHAGRQVVDGVLEDPRQHELNGRGEHDAQEAEREVAPVTCEVGPEPAPGSGSMRRRWHVHPV
jgi:hypothetical protein